MKKIFFIVDETLFFLPEWLERVVSGLEKDYKIVGITPLITKNHPTFYSHLLRNLYRVGLWGITKLVWQALKMVAKYPRSIKEVAQKHKIKIIECQMVNNPQYLKALKRTKPDIIISSCSQIFKTELLGIPKIACVNRHSALLPSYGGVFPLFWAMLNNEKSAGVTIHRMISKIDGGKIIFQKEIKVLPKESLFSLYQRVYEESAPALTQAIYILAKKKHAVLVKKIKPSYYSFPTNQDWVSFFKKGLKFI